ncbi:MAG TPA: signal peptide peptidase SppA [Steroidobacteraceae bacterium]|nr:signal peptide peptidase SppA [Steroidobacteraceae bacterium]
MAIGETIKGVLGFLWRALDALRKILHLVLLLIIFGFVFGAIRSSIPVVPHRAALVVDIEGQLVEQLSGDPFDRALGRATAGTEPETRLRDVLDAIKVAAKDDRIKVLVLDLDDMTGGGLAKLQDIGAALREFRKSGKKVIAVGSNYEQSQYYLAAQADEVYLDPLGYVFIDGYDYYRMYLKDALDKLAVDVNVFRTGAHKSYADGYTRNDMSPEEREETQAWLKTLWNAYQADVTAARKLQQGAIAQYADQTAALIKGAKGDTAKVALAQGLVTALKSRVEVEDALKDEVGEDETTHSFQSVDLEDYVSVLHSERALKTGGKNKVGVVIAAGEILDGKQPPGAIGGDSTSEILRDARYDDDIKAVVLRVDSPGGSVFASEQIYREVKALRAEGKPVIVSMGSVAASGGYYIGSGADEIWASPTTITGSIGVVAAIPTFQRTLQKLGVHSDGVGTTALSGDFRLDRPLGPGARDILQAGVEHAYEVFLDHVADGRGKTPAEIDVVAQGRVWSGADAREHGLVDHFGNLDAAVKAAAKRAKLGSDFEPKYLEPEMTWEELLALELRSMGARLAVAMGFDDPRPTLIRKALDPLEREAARWARFNDPQHLYSYCPCGITDTLGHSSP